MRLTLRTLLAHLDQTLDPADDAAIVAKLRESEFAQNLVTRIRTCVSNDKLAAPSPDSTSPADDPNRIGEYLDSVLLAEQVAEVERFCLESDARLAEVAACHQILSVALARPAEVPPALRSRIYGLSDQRNATIAREADGPLNDSATHASATQTVAQRERDPIAEAMTAPQASLAQAIDLAAAGIPPVGPDDSGVSDAPTRLRQNLPQRAERPEPAIAGSRRFSAAEASEIFGRSSRVVPWLVALALVASLLFVLSQAFKPLWNKPEADQVALQTNKATMPTDPTSQTPDAAEDAPVADAASSESTTPSNIDNETVDAVTETLEEEMTEPLVQPDPAVTASAANADPSSADPDDTASPVMTTDDAADEADATAGSDENEPPAPIEPSNPNSVPAGNNSATTSEAMNDVEKPLPPVEEVVKTEPAVAGVQSALISEQSLFLTRQPGADNFVQSKTGEAIVSGSELICPPLYRDTLNLGNATQLTMIGPASAKVETTADQPVALTLVTGRYLITETEPVVAPEPVAPPADAAQATVPVVGQSLRGSVNIQFGEDVYQLAFDEPGSVAAVDVVYRRQVGADPETPESISQVLECLCVQGEITCTRNGKLTKLQTGQVVSWQSGTEPAADPTPVTLPTVPDWINAPKTQPGSIEASAARGCCPWCARESPLSCRCWKRSSFGVLRSVLWPPKRWRCLIVLRSTSAPMASLTMSNKRCIGIVTSPL